MTKKRVRQTKNCSGCNNLFITYANYDYCANCAVNNSRYLTKSNCPECDGSGIIKFRGQKPRRCKICHLTKNNNPMNKKITKKPTAEEQF